MTDLITTLRAIIRDELSRMHLPDLGQVTEVFARDADGSDNNHEVNLRLRSTGVELQRVPVAVPRAGMSCLPRLGDLVLVSFLDGDLNAPIATGTVYDEEARPPVGAADEIVYQPLEDEASGVRRLHLELPGGATVTFEDEVLRIEAGDTSVIINRDGDVEVKAAGNLTVSATGDLKLSADGAVEITSGTGLTLKAGTEAKLEGSASTTVKGPQVTLAGMTQFSAS